MIEDNPKKSKITKNNLSHSKLLKISPCILHFRITGLENHGPNNNLLQASAKIHHIIDNPFEHFPTFVRLII